MYPIDLTGRSGLIFGVANNRSIAWAIAQVLDKAGCRLALAYQNERLKGRVEKLSQELSDAVLLECADRTSDGLRPGPEERRDILPRERQVQAQDAVVTDRSAAVLEREQEMREARADRELRVRVDQPRRTGTTISTNFPSSISRQRIRSMTLFPNTRKR